VDRDSWFELRPRYAPELVTGLGRIDGEVVGVVANQPDHVSGAIFPDSADEGAGFVWTCDAYNVPLIYLCDTPGFMIGSQVEREGVLRRGRKFIYATSNAQVPKLCVITRKAYGAGIYAMAGPSFGPDATLALPSAEISVMGPQAAVHALFGDQLEGMEVNERLVLVESAKAQFEEYVDIRAQASTMQVDELLPAGDLREQSVARLDTARGEGREERPRHHWTVSSKPSFSASGARRRRAPPGAKTWVKRAARSGYALARGSVLVSRHRTVLPTRRPSRVGTTAQRFESAYETYAHEHVHPGLRRDEGEARAVETRGRALGRVPRQTGERGVEHEPWGVGGNGQRRGHEGSRQAVPRELRAVTFLDSSVVIDYLDGNDDVVEFVDRRPVLRTSSIRVYEVLAGEVFSNGEPDLVGTRADFRRVTAVDFSEDVAPEAARLQNRLLENRAPTSPRDLFVAATARSIGTNSSSPMPTSTPTGSVIS